MELWIRTQSKQSLVKVDNVSINQQDEDRYNVDSDDWILGRYKTYERALEVLDEIQKILKPRLKIIQTDDMSLPIITGEWENSIREKVEYDTKQLPTYVYEMPKE